MNDTNLLVVIGIVVVGVAALFLLGPSPDDVAPPQVPLISPIADAGPNKALSECGSVRVGCDGFDPTGGAVSFQWTASAGSFDNPHALHPVYTAPSTCGLEDVTLTLTVTNEQNVIARDSLVVHVRDSIPCVYPVPCPVSPPCPVSVRNPGCVVPVPHVLPRRAPVCTPAPVVHPPVRPVCVPVPEVRPCQNPCPTPCVVCVKPAVITCSLVCPVESVVEGGSIQLRGTVWDIDRNLTNYYWTADKGRFDDPSSINPVYCAPMISNPCGENVCIALHAVDSCGATTASQIILHIRNLD